MKGSGVKGGGGGGGALHQSNNSEVQTDYNLDFTLSAMITVCPIGLI